MKICYVCPTVTLRRPIGELVDIMAKKGHKVSLIWPRQIGKDFDSSWHITKLVKTGKVNLIGIPCFYFPLIRYQIPVPFVSLFKVIKAMKKSDIVHMWMYFYPTNITVLLLKLLLGMKAKLILTIDGLIGYLYKAPIGFANIMFRLYTRTFGKLLFAAPEVITFYSKILLPYAKTAKMPLKKTVVIPTGIHLDKFHPDIKSDIRDEFSISRNTIIILFVGMLSERKGVDYIIGATKKMVHEGLDIKTLIVGEGPFSNKYKKMAQGCKEIIFTGNRHDIPKLMGASDVFVLPSRGEGLAGVVMEAMACGLPVVATDDGLTRDLVIDGKNGFLSRIGDFSTFYNSVEKLVKSKPLRLEMGKASRKHIKNFDWIDISGRYELLYKQLTKLK